MRASKPRHAGTHCPHCYLRREICVCPVTPKLRIKTEFLILRHVWESRRPSNTGRLVALAVPNARIIPCGGGDRADVSSGIDEELKAPGTWLLWPDGPGLKPEEAGVAPPRRIVVLDATWQQARRMFRRMTVLHRLPRLALPAPPTSRKRLRDQRRPDGMSTIEAVAAAVALLEGVEAARPLDALYDEVVRRTSALRWGIPEPDQSDG